MSGLGVSVRVSRPSGFVVEVDIDVSRGEVLALLGPNGAGKSTVAEAIVGLIDVDFGTVDIEGTRVVDASRGLSLPIEQRRVGLVLQDYVLFPHMTVAENVMFGAASGDTGRHWLRSLGLDGIADRGASAVSGGEAQRTALARAMAAEPSVLILDEPMSALDVSTRGQVRGYLAETLAEYGGATLLITHDPAEAHLLAERIVVIEDGRITQAGEPDEIRLRPKTRYVADLAGLNFFEGTASSGVVASGDGDVHIADQTIAGAVLLTIHPRAVAVHRERPSGSPRNVWRARVGRVEDYGNRVRVELSGPVSIAAEVTPAAIDAVGVEVGAQLWVSVKATEIGVEPV